MGDTRKPLAKDGAFSVRAALATERAADCDATGAICLEILYRAGQPEVACGWTVLFAAPGAAPKVVSVNDASAQYMLRRFALDDKDRPKLVTGVMPEMPPIAKVMHMSGIVTVRAVVDSTGKVHATGVVDATNPMLSSSAISAVNGWQMETFLLNGRALPYEERISFHALFSMSRYATP